MRLGLLVVVVLLVVALALPTRADWWDSFVDKVVTKLHEGADYIRDTAGPTVREKFDSAKAKLQDPETHASVQSWFKENVLPGMSGIMPLLLFNYKPISKSFYNMLLTAIVEEKWESAKQFVKEDVAPEFGKIVEAAREDEQSCFQLQALEKLTNKTKAMLERARRTMQKLRLNGSLSSSYDVVGEKLRRAANRFNKDV